MLTQIAREIFEFQINLPDTPLKSLNCYIIRPEDGGRCLLIDTGFHHPQCWAELRAGMEEAGLVPENTDVFLTHAHSDHTGNAAALHDLGCHLYMSSIDYALYLSWLNGSLEDRMSRIVSEGMPEGLVETLFREGPIMHYGSPWFPVTELEDGDILNYGVYELRCILTPGHTPGHMCLYDEKRELLFLGDHVLYDITPNITNNRGGGEDMLRLYMESLRKIAKLPVSIALPAHRSHGSVSLSQRVDQLLSHHQRRLDETLHIVQDYGPVNAYVVAAHLRWRIRAASWEDFPVSQKWFAVGETLTHLDYLCGIGAIRRLETDGRIFYVPQEEA